MARVFVFSRDLTRLYAELKCRTTRSWRLNAPDEQFGTATAYISIAEPQLSTELLRFRNVLWIHDGILPDWAGQIGEPQVYTQSEVSLSATAYECVLDDRAMSRRQAGAPGSLFRDLIYDANSREDTRITLGDVDDGGRDIRIGRSATILQAIQTIQRKTGFDWGVDAALTDSAGPTLTAWWRQNTGTDYSGEMPHIELDEEKNIELDTGNPIMTKTGRVKNSVFIYADSGNGENSYIGVGVNQSSRDTYGLAEYVTGETLKSETTTQRHAEREAANRGNPTIRFQITVNDPAVFPYLRMGNSFNLILRTVGWQNGRRGWTGPVRVVGMAYDDMENKVGLTLEDVTA